MREIFLNLVADLQLGLSGVTVKGNLKGQVLSELKKGVFKDSDTE
jgi:hypothetical protein